MILNFTIRIDQYQTKMCQLKEYSSSYRGTVLPFTLSVTTQTYLHSKHARIDLDLWNGTRSIMSIGREYSNYYLMVIVVRAMSLIVNEIFAVKICKPFTLTFTIYKVNCKYVIRKSMQQFLFHGRINIILYFSIYETRAGKM